MRISIVLAISLSLGLPALAQNALWGTSGNSSSNGNPGGGMPAGQGYGQGNTGASGSGTQGGNAAAAAARRKERPKSQNRLRRADIARGKMSGASTLQSYDENSSAAKSSQPTQSAGTANTQQFPASGAAPAQAAPAPKKPNGVQTY